MQMRFARIVGFLAWSLSALSPASPVTFNSPAYQSPVHGNPDDLLLIAGNGFREGDSVIYRSLGNTTQAVDAPHHVPAIATADFGIAPVVSYAGTPHSLTVRLPQILRVDQAYALWVHSARGEWSQAVRINDVRPLWISPAFVYATGSPVGLPREMKIVGRNLNGANGGVSRVRLIGRESMELPVLSDARSSPILDQYALRVALPDHMAPGTYRVQMSRDAHTWVELPGQILSVRPDKTESAKVSVSDARFGGCRPDDGLDDTGCIVRAIAELQAAGGGVLSFGRGTWDLIDGAQNGVSQRAGILVAHGIDLQGEGNTVTTVQRHREWDADKPLAAFTLVGNSTVSGFKFRDSQIYTPQSRSASFLRLGEDVNADGPTNGVATQAVDDIVISQNIFDKTMVAVAANGRPLRNLFITHNTFGAYKSALELSGDRFNMSNQYQIEDSVIDFNVFKPGSELNLQDKSGTIASELGAGRRVDFTGNEADGASADYLYAPDDPKGWRAAFFWNMDNNIEDVLVSQNVATCTGDKIGDGEAFAFDNNANTFAFEHAIAIVSATADTVTVAEPVAARQNGRDIPRETYYIGHWMQVVSGPGLGQSRKITGYRTDPVSQRTTFRLAPQWDVAPVASATRITIGREFWQLYVIDNRIDNRRPLCQKSNRSSSKAGEIAVWAQSTDSVIAGNHQYDSDGIFVQQAYIVPEHPCADCTMTGFINSFLEIRDNEIDGEYDWDLDCSRSGIALGVAAAPWDPVPPTVGFGINVSHNLVRHADGQYGGAIAQLHTWLAGPEPHQWPLSDGLIIQHNTIRDVAGPRALPVCGDSVPRVGIAFPLPAIAWRTALYDNTCSNVSTPVGVGGVDVNVICPATAADSCECLPNGHSTVVTTPLH